MKNAILDKSFNFSLDIVKLYLKLKNEKEYILSKQLVRSATSIGANVTEAQYAQSKKDFINKMSIALKEANESEYWLNLLSKAEIINEAEYKKYITHCIEVKILLINIVRKSKEIS
ncbi:MAG: four helix bundle protein [Clostridium sp.]|uniref:four helix bundle protein n=1 Tax=Clostridium sp. TaxID=1506 RepID=UPI00290C800E|nr:four helix bundle protein [Clostridium sp.]MDU5110464.1 four helix bundle protein [Clostridium sp.]